MDEISWKEKVNEQRLHVHQLLSVIENLYHDGDYAGSSEMLYSPIESCIDERPVASVIALFDYRVSSVLKLRKMSEKRREDLIMKMVEKMSKANENLMHLL